MTAPSHVEVLQAIRSAFEGIPAPREEREALDAAIALMRAPVGDADELVEAARCVIGVSDHAEFVSGVCCCGCDMDRHAAFDHAPTDSGTYYGRQALDRMRDAIAAMQQPTETR